ncbi:hypothetical protein DID88_000238 [Monilinia fructigena]|uniref:Metallo-beta-lactamase domain-containing protein n=1 Tax=Monilinia fructigena TaxID=38457 RepID=A0A395IM71_9HELO|nr:hypothetical protein DID88_000238 [Monilinia fructigena]
MSTYSTPYSSISTPATIVYDSALHDFEDPFHEYNTPPAYEMPGSEQTTHLQFVPPTGQSFTTLAQLRAGGLYKNKWRIFDNDERFWSMWTEPKFAIGQRAILIKTSFGNVLWDCLTFLDDETVDWIHGLGGLAAIVISHPHYYTTHLDWSEIFDCPVYLSWEDKSWLNRLDRMGKARTFIEGKEEELEIRGQKTGVKILKLGGHFPGSLVCLAHGRLLIADTLVTTPSALGDWSKGPGGGENARPDGMNSYAFMWSIPNMIPLNVDEVLGMWEVLKPHNFSSTHGAFMNTDVVDGSNGSEKGVKQRILESMQIQVRRMGWNDHVFLKENLDQDGNEIL